jgi:hypothetical protein
MKGFIPSNKLPLMGVKNLLRLFSECQYFDTRIFERKIKRFNRTITKRRLCNALLFSFSRKYRYVQRTYRNSAIFRRLFSQIYGRDPTNEESWLLRIIPSFQFKLLIGLCSEDLSEYLYDTVSDLLLNNNNREELCGDITSFNEEFISYLESSHHNYYDVYDQLIDGISQDSIILTKSHYDFLVPVEGGSYPDLYARSKILYEDFLDSEYESDQSIVPYSGQGDPDWLRSDVISDDETIDNDDSLIPTYCGNYELDDNYDYDYDCYSYDYY